MKLAKPGDELVGEWTGHFELSEADLQKATEVERRAAVKYFSQLKMEMTVAADGTYKMQSSQTESQGTWEFKDGKLYMTDSSAPADSAFKTQAFAVTEGGKRLVGKDPSGQDNTLMVFDRA